MAIAMPLMLAASTAGMALLAPLQPAAAQAASQSYSFSIAAQPLPAALVRFSATTGIDIVFNGTVPAGIRSPGVSGTLPADAALAKLLGGSGLTWRFRTDRTVMLIDPSETGSVGDTEGSTALSPIVVTGEDGGTNGIVAKGSRIATKSDTPILEVPQTVNVVTRKEMDARGAGDFNAAVAYTPGLRVIDYPGGQGMPDLYLRGFRAIGQYANYRDGIRNGFNSYDNDIEMFGLERLDVLKGPSSVLFGQSTPGGLVNATSKRPTEAPYREVQVEYGSYGRRQVTADFGGPVSEDDAFLYRFTALLRDSGTQIDHSPDDALYIAPAFTWKPDEGTSFTLLANYHKVHKGGGEQSLPMDNTIFDKGVRIPSSLYLGIPGVTEWNTQNTSVGYEFKHEFDNGWTFNQNVRYSHAKVDYTAGWIWDWPTTLFDGHYARIGAQQRPKTTNSFLVDNNIGGTVELGASEHNLLFGLDYGRYDSHERRANSTNFITIDIFDPVYDPSGLTFGVPWSDENLIQTQVGLYAQDQVRIDNWVLSFAGRYDWVKTDVDDLASAISTSERNHAFTGRAGIGYLFDNGLAPYLSYSTSFQPEAGTDFSGRAFEPTTGEQWEAGIKYQPLGWNGLVTASLFQITQQNVTTNDPLHPGFLVQEGEVRSRGFEIEAKADLTDALALTAAYSYTDTRITKDNPDATGISKAGTRMAAVPYHQASLWLDYAFQQEALSGLTVGGGVRFVGSSMAVMDGGTGAQVKVAGYTLLDAAVSYDFGARNPDFDGLKLTVSGSNLTDEKYFTPGFYSDTVLFGNRRAVKANLSYTW
ncbi:TonB-dependent siderophore receptor [Shinella sp. HZN7]|uniref:TonB-dependent siderophore receptor n=1 Tax=Shinella sp. (strain HZN7) TaxID=879274 RepID=UPI0007DAAB99|nr:TonB-dependent siderophore receptor [Shinella sp. HZN7]ANH08367.1 TonB-dependent receptor [Shinella sp. HZN7]